MHTLTRLTMVALTAAALAPLLPIEAQPRNSARAGNSRTRASDRITLAIVDSMPVATAKALIVRKANGTALLVLDRQHASPETLGLGLAVLRTAARTALAPGAQQVIPIQGGVPTAAPSAKRMGYLRGQLAAVSARPRGTLGTLGSGKFVDITDERSAPR
jgi:hypothetical protein